MIDEVIGDKMTILWYLEKKYKTNMWWLWTRWAGISGCKFYGLKWQSGYYTLPVRGDLDRVLLGIEYHAIPMELANWQRRLKEGNF